MISISGSDMGRLEKEFIKKYNFNSLILMECAAHKLFDHAIKYYKKNKDFIILCGSGNNGGDAYALSRLLMNEGYHCKIFALSYPKTKDAISMKDLLYNTNIYEMNDIYDYDLDDVSLIVDGIFGTGFSGELEENIVKLFDYINKSKSKKLAIDIPSGLNSDTGYVLDNAIKADETVCFQYIKHGLLLSDAKEYIGKLTCEKIGIHIENIKEFAEIIDKSYLKRYIKELPKNSYKNKMGKVLFISGSKEYAGAAVIQIKAANAMGIGLINIATDMYCANLIQTNYPNAIAIIIENECDMEKLCDDLESYDVLSIGSGIPYSELNDKLLSKIISKVKVLNKKCIIDAYAIKYVAKNNIVLGDNFILTPHIGEAAILLNKNVNDIKKDFVLSAKEIVNKYKANVLLKGATSLALSTKYEMYINANGCPVLSKGGSGDALCAITSALLSSHYISSDIAESAAMASFICGYASEVVSLKKGNYSGNISDVIDYIALSIVENDLLC